MKEAFSISLNTNEIQFLWHKLNCPFEESFEYYLDKNRRIGTKGSYINRNLSDFEFLLWKKVDKISKKENIKFEFMEKCKDKFDNDKLCNIVRSRRIFIKKKR
jgi:hypothetical protein